MLPTVGNETPRIIWYAAEVAGRIHGVALMENLVPDPDKRAALKKSADAIQKEVQDLANAYVARWLHEFVAQRITFGKGRGLDRGFDALISAISETVRTSLPDRSTSNPDYREVFPDGAETYTSPTIHEDADLALSLRTAVNDSKLTVKAEVVASLDKVIPVVGPAATELQDGAKQVNALFQAEMTGRKSVVDVLWSERKNVESALGRSGRRLARFIFFDFRKGSGEGPAGGGGEEGPPGGGEDPNT